MSQRISNFLFFDATNTSQYSNVLEFNDVFDQMVIQVDGESTGSYTHTIHLAGTADSRGLHAGTYSVDFVITNQVATQYTTIAAIAAALGEAGVTATGTLHSSDEGDITIVKVIEWVMDDTEFVALLDSSNQKMGLTQTTATTLTDTLTGGVISLTVQGKADVNASAWATQTAIKSEGLTASTAITSAGVYFIGTTGLRQVRIANNGTLGGVRVYGSLLNG